MTTNGPAAWSVRPRYARRRGADRVEERLDTLVPADDQRSISVEVPCEHARVQTQKHDSARWSTNAKLSHRLTHVQIRHLRVQQHDIGLKCRCAVNRFGGMIRLGEHAQVRLQQETRHQGASDEWRVLEHQERDHL